MDSTVSARMDSGLKEQAEAIMGSLGITHSAAIQALYAQIVLRGGLPFEIATPVKRTPLSRISKVVRRRASEYGIQRVYLFGSYARGDATAESDIDLRIDRGRLKGLQIGGFLSDVSDDLGLDVDVATTESLSGAFLESIEDEEVLLYEAQ